MNGAESLLTTLVNNDVEVCFTNPGTSEMHFVAALDEVDGMRCVLCLFEGVLSGAADGYARMAGKPASTLLHLGPGLGNSLANIHNAKKGSVPMVNIVGDHATYHLQYNAPLTSDIEGIAGPVSHWVKTSTSPDEIATDAAEAVRQAGFSQIATLVLPADVSWGENSLGAQEAVAIAEPATVDPSLVQQAITMLQSDRNTMIMIGGRVISHANGLALSQISKVSGARVATETFPGRVSRGAGAGIVERLPYLAELAIDYMKDVEQLIVVGANSPVSFFAYPGVPSCIAPKDCDELVLALADDNIDQVLAALVTGLGADSVTPDTYSLNPPELPTGTLDAAAIGAALARLMPENAIVVDEGITSGLACYPMTASAQPHDWLNLTGGSIGWGLPATVGAAIACPDRKVISLEGDGSAMYTIQSLWTMARENLDVAIVIFNNAKYSILELEFARTGARGGKPGPKASSTLDIGTPNMDFVALAEGMGVAGGTATTAEEFVAQLQKAIDTPGPYLIDAILRP